VEAGRGHISLTSSKREMIQVKWENKGLGGGTGFHKKKRSKHFQKGT